MAARGEIYPWGYDCTYYPHRLTEPGKVRQPSRIFVSDTGDLFGRWVPKAWISEVLAVATECWWHTFIFLTKNPEKYREFVFPPNTWVGTSVTSDRDRKKGYRSSDKSGRRSGFSAHRTPLGTRDGTPRRA